MNGNIENNCQQASSSEEALGLLERSEARERADTTTPHILIYGVKQCLMCELRLSNYKLLVQYMVQRHRVASVSWRCPRCPKTFTIVTGVAAHLQHCKGSSPREASEPGVEVNDNEGKLKCVVDGCGRSFTSATGLGSICNTSTQVVHNERFAGVKRALWREDELRRIAHMEIEGGDLVNINQYIASKLPGRSDEAVKKVCKRHDYLEIPEDVLGRGTVVRANVVSPPNKRLRTIKPLNASEVVEQLEDGDEELLRSHPEISVPQFEGTTLEAKSFRTTALLAVEGKISVDTLFRKFLDRYLKGAREKRMTGGDSRGGGRSGNKQEPVKDARTKRRVRKERPSEKRFRLAQALFNRSEKDCLDAILSVNGFEREEVTLTGTEKDAVLASVILRLYTKIFANRLNAYELLSGVQRGFVRSPGCFENVYSVRALLKTAREEKRSIAILAIVLAKAFDSGQYTSVQRALNRFGAE
ncbi:hypothetical protein QYM36_019326 [Artemia franciscana]|uniref:C2H2-type domain-containing protein n=1 Tax=Artemia franciscana TaxID=6661 RepID=A0AA88HAV5_ARTSF|nr:hypothetical protein QYM36_019326 [Artemia franciscana]